MLIRLIVLIIACIAVCPGGRAWSLPAKFPIWTGNTFVSPPPDLHDGPRLLEITVPAFADSNSIWGATGRDARGHIWIGVSAHAPGMSAHLFEYDPEADQWRNHGAVVEQLRAVGLHRFGEGQIKIHSKIVAAADGWLYFASTDEEGEGEDGSALPRWGGHLWRIHPRSGRWQHLARTREGLVAVGGVGRYMYALGYWGHVLYQYDTLRRTLRRREVGAVPGHASRNLVVDWRGHAFVPRVRTTGQDAPQAELVEFDTGLRARAATPLAHYLGKESPADNHGITGLAWLADGRLLFTTHVGQLYEIRSAGKRPATVRARGWFHPDGERYAPSLFALGGGAVVAGVTQLGQRFDWVVRDLDSGGAAAYPLDLGARQEVLLYGSASRDDRGRAYLVGWTADGAGGHRPLVLRLGGSPAVTPPP